MVLLGVAWLRLVLNVRARLCFAQHCAVVRGIGWSTFGLLGLAWSCGIEQSCLASRGIGW
eukprot:6959664-Pyramimonas_sp.AAC.1